MSLSLDWEWVRKQKHGRLFDQCPPFDNEEDIYLSLLLLLLYRCTHPRMTEVEKVETSVRYIATFASDTQATTKGPPYKSRAATEDATPKAHNADSLERGKLTIEGPRSTDADECLIGRPMWVQLTSSSRREKIHCRTYPWRNHHTHVWMANGWRYLDQFNDQPIWRIWRN